MTVFDRFDLVDARVAGAIDEIAAASRPDYLDDVFQVTARTRQRPRWTFLERWLPMDTAIAGRPGFRRAGMRPLVVFLVLVLLALAASPSSRSGRGIAWRRRSDPRANGSIVYGYGGDLYVRDTLEAEQRLLIGGPGRAVRHPASRSTASLSPTTTSSMGSTRYRRQRRRHEPARDARPADSAVTSAAWSPRQPSPGARTTRRRRQLGPVDRRGRRIGCSRGRGQRAWRPRREPTTRRTTAPCWFARSMAPRTSTST